MIFGDRANKRKAGKRWTDYWHSKGGKGGQITNSWAYIYIYTYVCMYMYMYMYVYIYIYAYAVELASGPRSAFFESISGPRFVCFFVLLFLKDLLLFAGKMRFCKPKTPTLVS